MSGILSVVRTDLDGIGLDFILFAAPDGFQLCEKFAGAPLSTVRMSRSHTIEGCLRIAAAHHIATGDIDHLLEDLTALCDMAGMPDVQGARKRLAVLDEALSAIIAETESTLWAESGASGLEAA